MKKISFLAFAILLSAVSSTHAWAQDDLLKPQEAFSYTVETDAGEIVINWDVADGYYMYRERLGLESEVIKLDEPLLPKGKIKEDIYFGEAEVYRGKYQMRVPYTATTALKNAALTLKSQGCADIGLCYPPQRWPVTIDIPASAKSGAPAAGGLGNLLDRFGTSSEQEAGEFLPPDEAFIFSADMLDPYRLKLRWDIADEYYLYSDQFKFGADSLVQLGEPEIPRGKPKFDEHFGDVEVFYKSVEIIVPVSRASGEEGEFTVEVESRGCADAGLCYPPHEQSALVYLPAADAGGGMAAAAPATPGSTGSTGGSSGTTAPIAEQDKLAAMLASGNLFAVLGSFFVLGLLLAFTPCVLPMVPILSGIIAGEGENVTTRRAFMLSMTYVLGMALTYTIAGILAAQAGQQLQTFFQTPAIIVGIALLFVALAFAMFGFYELQMPSAFQTRVNAISDSQKGGTFVGTAIMGVLSALVVTACIAPPLVASLTFIAQSGDMFRGGASLFALAIGMGTPLIVIGTSAGKLLPKAGPWMKSIQAVFGVLFLGLAIYMLERLLPAGVIMFMWGALLLVSGVYLGAFTTLDPSASGGRKLVKGLGLISAVYGAMILVGGAAGGHDPLQPLAALKGRAVAGADGHGGELVFERVKTIDDLELAVRKASAAGQPLMLDFYADWCTSCKEMEKYTFTDAGVQAALANAVVVQADVTANDDADKALLEHFGIFGPPTIVFFGADGTERRAYRVVGFMKAKKFSDRVRSAFSAPAESVTANTR